MNLSIKSSEAIASILSGKINEYPEGSPQRESLQEAINAVNAYKDFDPQLSVSNKLIKDMDSTISMCDRLSIQYLDTEDLSLYEKYDRMRKQSVALSATTGDYWAKMKSLLVTAERKLKSIRRRVQEDLMEKGDNASVADRKSHCDDRYTRCFHDVQIITYYEKRFETLFKTMNSLAQATNQSVANARSNIIQQGGQQ